MLNAFPSNSFFAGANYMVEGIRLLWHPKLRIYILVPLLVNCLLFVVLTSFFYNYLSNLINQDVSFIPEFLAPFLAPLKWLAWLIIGSLTLIIYGYSFNVITNIIAAPFYGLLAEAAEKILTGQDIPPESLWKMIPRVLSRELSKLFYFLGRGILVILVMILVALIPIVSIVAPLIGLAWGAWSMAIQYADYPADNHQTPFGDMRNCLWHRIRSSLGFGGTVMGCSIIPIINIFAMPAAVTGGTIYWLNELKSCRSVPEPAGTSNSPLLKR